MGVRVPPPAFSVHRLPYLLLLPLLLACSTPIHPPAPLPLKTNTTDPFSWLDDPTSDAAQRYLAAENKYAEDFTQSIDHRSNRILRQLLERITTTKKSHGIRIGHYTYHSLKHPGDRFVTFARYLTEQPDTAETILDPNKALLLFPNASIQGFRLSPSHQKIALLVDFAGDGDLSALLYSFDSQEPLVIDPGQIHSLEWSTDEAFLYLTLRHGLQARTFGYFDLANETFSKIYEEQNPKAHLSLKKTARDNHLFVISETITSTAIFGIDISTSSTQLNQVLSRQETLKILPFANNNATYLLQTNLESGKVVLALRPFKSSAWSKRELDVSGVRYAHSVGDSLVVYASVSGVPSISVHSLTNSKSYSVPIPEGFYHATHYPDRGQIADGFRFTLHSPFRPSVLFQHSFSKRETKPFDSQDTPLLEPKGTYSVEQLTTSSGVPISLLRKSSGTARATVLFAYGAYGDTIDLTYSPLWLTLLDRNFSVAIAHIRGGGFLGPAWHHAGRGRKKKQSVSDLISTTQFLKDRHPSTHQLSLVARSAGATIAGAALNQDPSLFTSVILEMPFLDVAGTMANPDKPLTQREYDEWGNPGKPSERKAITKYCPYSNIGSNNNYPPLLIMTSKSDTVIPYSQALKYTAKLRHTRKNNTPLVINVAENITHSGLSTDSESLKNQALMIAFIEEYGMGVRQ